MLLGGPCLLEILESPRSLDLGGQYFQSTASLQKGNFSRLKRCRF